MAKEDQGTSCSFNWFCTFTLLCVSSLSVSNSWPNIQLRYYPNSVNKSLVNHLRVQSPFCKISYGTVYLSSGDSDGQESACSVGDLGSTPGWEDPLEEGMDTHSRILAQRTPCTGEPGGYSSWGHRVRYDWAVFTHSHVSITCLHSASLVKMLSKGHTVLIPYLCTKIFTWL